MITENNFFHYELEYEISTWVYILTQKLLINLVLSNVLDICAWGVSDELVLLSAVLSSGNTNQYISQYYRLFPLSVYTGWNSALFFVVVRKQGENTCICCTMCTIACSAFVSWEIIKSLCKVHYSIQAGIWSFNDGLVGNKNPHSNIRLVYSEIAICRTDSFGTLYLTWNICRTDNTVMASTKWYDSNLIRRIFPSCIK